MYIVVNCFTKWLLDVLQQLWVRFCQVLSELLERVNAWFVTCNGEDFFFSNPRSKSSINLCGKGLALNCFFRPWEGFLLGSEDLPYFRVFGFLWFQLCFVFGFVGLIRKLLFILFSQNIKLSTLLSV